MDFWEKCGPPLARRPDPDAVYPVEGANGVPAVGLWAWLSP